MASPRTAKRNGILLALLLGLLLGGFGLYLLTLKNVECGSRIMQPGDTCDVRNKAQTLTLDYDQQRASQTRIGALALGVGVLFLGYAGWTFRTYRAEPAERAAGPAA